MNEKTRRGIAYGGYVRLVKPILFRFKPDDVHHVMVRTAFWLSRRPVLLRIGTFWLRHTPTVNLQQTIQGITFENPVGLAAGIDKNGQMTHVMQMVGAGFSTVGSVTFEPRIGNPKPWFYRLPRTKGIVVYAGMANQGLLQITPRLENRPKDFPVITSVAVVAQKKSDSDEQIINDVKKAVSHVVDKAICEILEINISCPNVQDDEPFSDPMRLEKLLSALDDMKLEKPVFLKMPNRRDWTRFEPIL
ncbi:hypothetical protein B7Z28_00945, partial [Candidatus Saccharibacteria bacterium 32-45-3]